jgi:hypothetical protein
MKITDQLIWLMLSLSHDSNMLSIVGLCRLHSTFARPLFSTSFPIARRTRTALCCTKHLVSVILSSDADDFLRIGFSFGFFFFIFVLCENFQEKEN